MYKRKCHRTAAWVPCYSEVGIGFFWLSTQGVQVPAVTATSLLKADILVRLLKGNLSSI